MMSRGAGDADVHKRPVSNRKDHRPAAGDERKQQADRSASESERGGFFLVVQHNKKRKENPLLSFSLHLVFNSLPLLLFLVVQRKKEVPL